MAETDEVPLAGRAEHLRLARRLLCASLVLISALLAVAALAAAAVEVEPNNDIAGANLERSTGSYLIQGSTDSTLDPSDFFNFSLVETAVVEIQITSDWGCAGSSCERMEVFTSARTALFDPFGAAMVGDDVYFSGLAEQHFFVQVRAGTPGGPYTLKVTVHPFQYQAGERVDVREANSTSAIVALAAAEEKGTVHPYNLEFEGDGVYYGYSLKLFVVNVGPVDLTVVVPAGLRWISENAIYTNYVVTRTQTITVRAWTYEYPEFIAVAESPYGWVPGDPSRPDNDPTYFLGPMASGDLRKVTDETDRAAYSHEAEQIAVWAVTTGLSKADFDQLGASRRGYSDAQYIVITAGVGTAINPPSSYRSSWLTGLLASWPFCFAALFIGLPVLFGVSQALRAVRLASRRIDTSYSYSRTSARDAARERKEYIRPAREREKERARERKEERRAAREHRSTPAAVVAPVAARPVPTAVGPATPFQRLMRADAHENFDLDALNSLDYNAVLAEAVAGKESAALASKKGEELRTRLHQDVHDPDTIDDILRDRMLEWYRQSPTRADWSASATAEWAGLVAESTTGGGRRRAPLEKRLAALQDACDAKGKWIKPKPRVEERGKRGAVSPSAAVDPIVLRAEVTQAVLDDLAGGTRKPDQPFPLPILSELAARYTPQRVNNVLAEMFKAEPRGPFVVLHPSRYPDTEIAAIRPPAQGAKAGAMSYDIYFAKAASAVPQAAPGGFVPTSGSIPGLIDTSSAIWTRDNVSKEEWSAVLQELQRQRQRMDPPPSNYRKLPAYFTLRQLLVADGTARLAFIGTKWRGKPVGLPLLAQLLTDKAFTPEYDTDREYFEAELGDLERGDPNYLSASGSWTIAPGVVVKRSGGETGQFSYSV